MSKRKLILWLLISLLLVSGAVVVAWKAKLFGMTYTAKAYLELAPVNPTIFGAAEKYDPVAFEMFRDTQATLIKTEKVMTAALRDPQLKNLSCIRKADSDDVTGAGAVQWLTEAIRVDVPAKGGGIIVVSASEPADRDDPSMPPGKPAQVIVNAVVQAYMNNVVNTDKEKREQRLSELDKARAMKEGDVRKMRAELKKQEDDAGVADERSLASQVQLAASLYMDFQREFLKMKAEQRVAVGNLREAENVLNELENDQADAEISDYEVISFLNGDSIYRDLRSRLAILESTRPRADSPPSDAKPTEDAKRAQAECEATKAQLDKLYEGTRKMIRDAKLMALRREKRHWQHEVDILAAQGAAFEKEVEKKKEIAESVAALP